MVRRGNDLEFSEKGIERSRFVGRKMKLAAQDTLQLANHQLADHQLVLLDHDFKKLSTKAAGTERAR